MNGLDNIQRIVIAGAVAVGVISVAFTLSGAWPLPGTQSPSQFQNNIAPQPPAEQSSQNKLETALSNDAADETYFEELSIKAVDNLLPPLLSLEQQSLSQGEGEKLQQELVQKEVERLLANDTSTIPVPEPVFILAKDSGREAKLSYIAGVMKSESDIKTIHAFLANPDNLSSEAKMRASVPNVLPAYGRVLLAGGKIPVPPVWAGLHRRALRGLSAQSIGLSVMLGFRSDSLTAPYAIQTFFDGMVDYKEANELLLSQFKKDGFSVP